MKRRFLSMILSLTMLSGVLSSGVSAAGATDIQNDDIQTYTSTGDQFSNGGETQESPYPITTADAKRFNDDSEQHIAVLGSNLVQFADCSHETVNNWRCTACGKQVNARVTDWNEKNPKWYSDINKAISSVGGEYRMVMLKDGAYTFTEDIPVYGNVNIFFPGDSSTNFIGFDDGHSFVVESGGFLSLGANTHIKTATVKAGGGFGEQSDSIVDHLILEEGCALFTNGRMQLGKFGKITVPAGRRVRDVVFQSDRELSFRHTDGTWATEEELLSTEIEDVSIVSLPFSSPKVVITSDDYYFKLNNKIEQLYNGNNEFKLSITTTYGSITDYKWVIDYYAPDSENVTETKELTEASPVCKLNKVGTYKVKCTITSDGYSKTRTGDDIVIKKADCTYTAPTANELIYNGKEQALVLAGSANGGTMCYSLNGTDWSETVPTAKNADSYTVYYKVFGNANYNDSPVRSVEVTINPFEISDISTTGIKKTYDGTVDLPDKFTVTFNSNTALSNGEDYIITEGKYASPNANTDIDVTLKVKLLNPNYIFKDGNKTSIEKQFTVKGAINKAIAPYSKLGMLKIFKGVEKSYTFDLNTLLGELPKGCTYGNITFKDPVVDIPDYYDGPASITDGILTLPVKGNKYGDSAAGYVTITVEMTNYEDFTITVSVEADNQITPDVKPKLSTYTITYGDKLSSIKISDSNDDDASKINGTFAWVKPDEIPSAGEYTAEWIFTPVDYKYTTLSGRINITVNKADCTYTAPTANVLTYNGSEQALVLAGSANGGTMYYSLNGTDWSETVPTAKNADSYTVYYKVEGDKNHKGIDNKSIDVSIAKLPVIIKWSNIENHVYDGSEKTISAEVTNTVNADAVKLTLGGTYSAVGKGEYTANVAALDNINYTTEKGTNTTVKWSIAQAANTIENLAINGWTYGESANKPSANARFGDIVYSYASDKNGSYSQTVPRDAGTYWVKASVIETDNYKGAQSDPKQFEIAKKSIENAAVGAFEQMTYNGKAQTPKAEVVIDNLTATGTWSNVTNVGDTSDFTANGNFTGTITGKATGMARKSIADEDVTVTIGDSPTYNGEEQTQSVTAKLGEIDVTFDVSGNKATNVETDGYTLTVTGSGNFTGTKTVDWKILPAKPKENTEKKTTASVYRGRKLADASVTNGELFGIDGKTVLEGTFAWIDDTKVMNANGTEQIKFTPNDKNYCDITLDVAVSTYLSGGGGSSSIMYTVKFDTDGGSKVLDVKVSRNDKVKEPAAPSKDGFEFAGWFTDKELKNKFDFSSRITKNLTLYAAWTKDKTDPEPNPTDKPENTEKEISFDDVSKDDWYYNDVIKAVKKGLFAGTGSKTFAPDDIITRGMFVTVLYRTEGEPEVNKSITFADVKETDYYANAVIWAEQNDIAKGISETEFAPNDNITREQIAVIMFRYAKYKGYDVTQGGMQIREFSDYESISGYAADAVNWAVNTGLMKGKTETAINPQDNATRAETAAILNRFIEAAK